jgi:CheY-like chemotaxis protein
MAAPMTSAAPSQSSARPLVLCVDDNEVQLYAVGRTLKHRGFRTVMAMSGEEAVRVAVAQKPEAVLLDIVLRDINGLDVCRRIHQEPTLRKTAVVFYSALTAADFETHGGDAFLTYPVSEENLVEVLEKAIGRHTIDALQSSTAPSATDPA